MKKDKLTQIYILAYSKVPEYGLLDDKFHTPIQCGKALTGEKICKVCDNTGDNISEKNPWFVETTGIYWIWKNDNHAYKGQFQYRRHFDFDVSKTPLLLKKYDIILPEPFVCNISLRKFYDYYHIVSDLDLCGKIVKEKYPEYSESWDKYIENGRILFYSNGFITTRKKYNDICSFVFDILFEYEKRMGFTTKEEWVKHGELAPRTANSHKGEISNAEYQSRVGGYLFERLFTLYVLHNFKKVVTAKYVLKEDGMTI